MLPTWTGSVNWVRPRHDVVSRSMLQPSVAERESLVMAKVLSRSGNEVTVSVTVRLGGSLLEMEEAIREATNESAAASPKRR